jgi:hypothetical protein
MKSDKYFHTMYLVISKCNSVKFCMSKEEFIAIYSFCLNKKNKIVVDEMNAIVVTHSQNTINRVTIFSGRHYYSTEGYSHKSDPKIYIYERLGGSRIRHVGNNLTLALAGYCSLARTIKGISKLNESDIDALEFDLNVIMGILNRYNPDYSLITLTGPY